MADDKTTAKRGFVFITTAKVYFLLTSLFAQLAFPRLFGDPVLFGRYRVVSALLNVFSMVIITATVQAVSRFASQKSMSDKGVIRGACIVQACLFLPIFFALLLGSNTVASYVFHDKTLSSPIRASSFVLLAYAFYAVFVGVINGTKRFARQAGLDITFSTLKTLLMVVLVVLTSSVTLAFSGFAIAGFVVLLLSVFLARPFAEGETLRPSQYLSYILPIGAWAFLLNLLLQVDVIAIKAKQFEGGADEASLVAAVYGAAKNLAIIPYQTVISLSFVAFPFVASASNAQKAKGAASSAIRASAILSLLALVFIYPMRADLLSVIFGAPYKEASSYMLPLLCATSFLAMMHVANAVVASASRPFLVLWSGGLAVATQVLLLIFLLGSDTKNPAILASYATLAGCAVGGVASLFVAFRLFEGGFFRTLFSTFLGAGVSTLISKILEGILHPVAIAIVATSVFVLLLFITKGVTLEEVKSLLASGRRRPNLQDSEHL